MDKYLVVAGEDGCVRFYDFSLRIMAWYEDLNAGPVTSVSFASNAPSSIDDSASDFVCPDFVVGTSTSYIIGVECSLFQEIEPENRRGAVLVQGIGDHAPCIAAHPTMDRLVIGVADGTLQLWDFMTRTLLMVQDLMSEGGVKQRPQSCQFDASGRALALGMTSGMLKVSDPDSLQEMASFANGDMPITTIRFSPDSSWLAYADTANYVYVLNFAIVEEAPQPEVRVRTRTTIILSWEVATLLTQAKFNTNAHFRPHRMMTPPPSALPPPPHGTTWEGSKATPRPSLASSSPLGRTAGWRWCPSRRIALSSSMT